MPNLNDRRDNNTRLAEGLLLFLVSVGLVAAATIALFSVASVSLLGTSKEILTRSPIDNNPIEDKFIGPVPCPDGAVAMCVGICWRGLRWDEDTGSGSQVNRLFSKVLV
jgi:hypothetical protein